MRLLNLFLCLFGACLSMSAQYAEYWNFSGPGLKGKRSTTLWALPEYRQSGQILLSTRPALGHGGSVQAAGLLPLDDRNSHIRLSATLFTLGLYSEMRSGLQVSRSFGKPFRCGIEASLGRNSIRAYRPVWSASYAVLATLDLSLLCIDVRINRNQYLRKESWHHLSARLSRTLAENYTATGGFIYHPVWGTLYLAGLSVQKRNQNMGLSLDHTGGMELWYRAGRNRMELELGISWRRMIGAVPESTWCYDF